MCERIGSKEGHPANCVFCNLIESGLDIYKLAESDTALAVMSLEGHPIVLTKTHVDDSNRGTHVSDILGMFELANSLDAVTREAYKVDSLNIVQNRGEGAGQEVSHYHVHLIPRSKGDKRLNIKLPQMLDEKRVELSGMIQKILSSSLV